MGMYLNKKRNKNKNKNNIVMLVGAKAFKEFEELAIENGFKSK